MPGRTPGKSASGEGMGEQPQPATTEKAATAAVLCSQCQRALRDADAEVGEAAGSGQDEEDNRPPRRRPGNAGRRKEKSGPSQDDLRVYITMAIIMLLAFFVTMVKVAISSLIAED